MSTEPDRIDLLEAEVMTLRETVQKIRTLLDEEIRRNRPSTDWSVPPTHRDAYEDTPQFP